MHHHPNSSTPRRGPCFAPALAAALLAGASLGVSAQTTGSGADRGSWIPGTSNGYVGLNVGRSEYGSGCGIGAFGCDDPKARIHLYTGALYNEWLGLEIGYLNEGTSDRGGGSQRAEGVNLSAVFRMPIGAFSAYAKAGALYGRTRVSSSPLAGIVDGREKGWGTALALGAGYELTPRGSVVAEWSRNEFRFPGGGGRSNVDALSVGYVHRF